MRSIILATVAALFCLTPIFAQDTISRTSGHVILAKVVELTPTDVKFKIFKHENRRTYTIPRSKVSMILYQNGSRDVMEQNTSAMVDSTDSLTSGDLYAQGGKHAEKYYRGYRDAATSTFIVSLLSPVVGVIPAVACSATKPRKESLNYPKEDFMQKEDYAVGYKERAATMKRLHVWGNWGTAFAINLILTLFIANQAK